ncbi:MAG: dTDP-4-dehydrorhamnose 3,5-epimerase [Myxococcota bacterium]
MSFTTTSTTIPDVFIIEGRRFGDDRGFFTEDYREEAFRGMGLPPFVQINHSRSTKDVLRGLHYQLPPAAMGKLVRCVVGRILDVAVDIRKGSATFGQHVAVELGESETRFLWVPAGFAHGFLTLSDRADVMYKQSHYWSPDHERSIRWNDEALAIPWPTSSPVLSGKDAAAPSLEAADLFP